MTFERVADTQSLTVPLSADAAPRMLPCGGFSLVLLENEVIIVSFHPVSKLIMAETAFSKISTCLVQHISSTWLQSAWDAAVRNVLRYRL